MSVLALAIILLIVVLENIEGHFNYCVNDHKKYGAFFKAGTKMNIELYYTEIKIQFINYIYIKGINLLYK